MKALIYLICTSVILTACSPILRQPEFSDVQAEQPAEEIEYKVKTIDVTRDVVESANKDSFVRFVNWGRGGGAPVRRVPESEIFAGKKPVANKKALYRLSAGDELELTRFGQKVFETGIVTRGKQTASYVVDERGAIELDLGRTVFVQGLTIDEATSAIRSAVASYESGEQKNVDSVDLPTQSPPIYRLGEGDVLRITTLAYAFGSEEASGPRIVESVNVVGPDGAVSILTLGEIEVLGLTLAEVRNRVLQEARRNAVGEDIAVEVEDYRSQSIVVSGSVATATIPVTNNKQTYDQVIAKLLPTVSKNQDFRVTLTRDGKTYEMLASDILKRPRRYYVFDGDQLIISEQLSSSSNVKIVISEFGARRLTYLRVTSAASEAEVQSRIVPIDLRGLDLRQLLIEQGVDVNLNRDLLVRLSRGNETFRMSAQSVLLKSPNLRYWLEPDDHVTVEDIPYVGDTALLVGELESPKQLRLNRHVRTTLSDALFQGGLFEDQDADFKHIYVLRGGGVQFDAYHFDVTQVLNLSLAKDFELRPGDIVFVRTRPLTRYNRALGLALSFVNAIDVGLSNARNFGE